MDLTWLSIFNNIDLNSFKIGFLSATTAIAVLAILFKIWCFLFLKRQKQSSGIQIPTENGSLFIATHAISDLIKTLENDFLSIKIQKVALYQITKDTFRINLEITFNVEKDGLIDITSSLQNRILADLKNIFGITVIEEINIKIKKASVKNIDKN